MDTQQFPGLRPGTPVDHDELYRFGARHSLVINQAQEQFSNWLGDDWQRYDFDLTAGTMRFGEMQVRVQLLGSHSYETDTWLWAWGNENYQSAEFEKVTEASRWLRDACADRDRAWQLRTRIFPVGEQLATGGLACWPLHYACFAWLGARAAYSADYGPGRFFVTIHDESVPVPRPDPVTLPRVLYQSMTATGLPAPELLQTFADWHQMKLTNAGTDWTLDFAGGSTFTVSLDEHGRPVNITGSMNNADVVPDEKAPGAR